MSTTFFPTPEDFRKWLAENHESETELWVGYYKKHTKLPSMNWSESVDQALCYGWIDGLRKSIDDKSYKIRFTPRRPTSIWSAVNVKKIEELTKAGLMMPAGIEAWNKRREHKTQIYSYEQVKASELYKAYEKKIKASPKAWEFFDALAPSYKKNTVFWVMSAKREETRLRRLQILVESAEQGLMVPHLRKK